MIFRGRRRAKRARWGSAAGSLRKRPAADPHPALPLSGGGFRKRGGFKTQRDGLNNVMTNDLRRVSRALISVSDKTGVVDFARALAGPRRRAGFHRRHAQDFERRRAQGARRQRSHRFSRDDGRPGQDAASGGPWRLAGDARQRRAHRSNAGAQHPADRSVGGQSLSVRSHHRARRRFCHLHREHRHRRPGDDPRRGEEPRRRRRGGRGQRLRRGAGRAHAARRRDHAGAAPPARRQGLCAHGGL